jgi:DNA-binding transcriptional MerR regulator
MPDELMQIGEVAELTGFSQRTIRHYEEVGLVVPARTAGGFRLYGETEVTRLRLIKQMRPLEFTLADMGELLETLDRLNEPGGILQQGERSYLLKRLKRFEDQAMACTERLRRQMLTSRELSAELRQLCAESTDAARTVR